MNWQQNISVYVNIFKGTAFVNLSEHPFQGGINYEGTLKVFIGLTVGHTAHLDASLEKGVGYWKLTWYPEKGFWERTQHCSFPPLCSFLLGTHFLLF